MGGRTPSIAEERPAIQKSVERIETGFDHAPTSTIVRA